MKTIQTKPEFTALLEDEIVTALDEFENLFGEDEEIDMSVEPENAIVAEVARLISEYTNRFDQYCEKIGEEELPEEIFNYEPEVMIERVAYEIFMDAVHDAMQEEDNDDDSE